MGGMKDRMRQGALYIADDAFLTADHARAQDLLDRYNATRHSSAHTGFDRSNTIG